MGGSFNGERSGGDLGGWEAAIDNPNPVVHPVATLLSATRIEHSRSEFFLYAEGMTPAVARTYECLNDERLSICNALGYKLYHWDNLEFENYNLGETEEECRHWILNTSMDASFGKDGIYAGIKTKGPEHLKDRYVTEDVTYGMVLLSTLGDLLGISTPTHDAVIQLASVINRTDYRRPGEESNNSACPDWTKGVSPSLSYDGTKTSPQAVKNLVIPKT